jgi:hypothetical protein
MHLFGSSIAKRLNYELKSRPEQLLGYLSFVIELLDLADKFVGVNESEVARAFRCDSVAQCVES